MSFDITLHREVAEIQTVQDTALGIMKWGRTNTFPQTLRNLINQSPSAKPVVDRTKKFIQGGGFEGEDEIVNAQGMTLKRVVSILADDQAYYKAFAIHTNFNRKGVPTSITPIRIADLRFNEFDELNYSSKLGYHSNFGLNSEVVKTVANQVTKSKIKWIDRFNPDAVIQQIEKTDGGLSNYQGQILYYTETGFSNYPEPPLLAQINYVLSDIENSILVRKETSTGFISSYILKTMLAAEDPDFIALEMSIDEAQGARGSGKIISMTGLSPDEMTNTVLEEIGSGNRDSIIESATKTYNLDQRVIASAYLIPPILSGGEQKTGFSSAELKEAYFVFNAVTQPDRDTIESELNRILKIGDFKTKSISIRRLTLDEEVPTVAPTTDNSNTSKEDV